MKIDDIDEHADGNKLIDAVNNYEDILHKALSKEHWEMHCFVREAERELTIREEC